jgi:hypothetical protein
LVAMLQLAKLGAKPVAARKTTTGVVVLAAR